MSEAMDGIINEILKTKKYAGINEDVLQRICKDSSEKYKKPKDALKAAKTELHIINESYLLNDCHKKAKSIIFGYNGTSPECDRELSRSLLSLHTSSKERLEHIEEIYSFLSEFVDSETVIGDIGCGFAPFALSYFSEKPKGYYAYEMNNETVEVLNSYFRLINNTGYNAYSSDAVLQTPQENFDTVFLFKLLPVLHQQKKGREIDVLRELKFGTGIISFPLKSLSGKEKGMREHYSEAFENGISGEFNILKKTVIGNELFYVLEK